jgi:prepilin-type N-terminal cleavage/methylation domain-containing protein
MKRFTMIELLMVVAVIGILVTIILPNILKSREIALRYQCASQLGSIGKSITMQMTENNNTLPSYNWMYNDDMYVSYLCPKDDSPRYLDFYLTKNGYWANKGTSFGYNLSSVGEKYMRNNHPSEYPLFFDSHDLYGTYIKVKGNGNDNNGHGNNVGSYDPSNPGKKENVDGISDDVELKGSALPNWTTDLGGLQPEDYKNWYYDNLYFRHLNTANHLMLDGTVKIIRQPLLEYQIIWDWR